jgi:hypothetical protein
VIEKPQNRGGQISNMVCSATGKTLLAINVIINVFD